MISFAQIVKGGYGMFTRVFPRCSMIAQAIAFNLFLAFFPALLIVVALATTRIGGKTSLLEMVRDFTEFLPPGSQSVVSEFLVSHGPEAWKVALLGWSGTLLAGSQVMKLVMEGIHIIYGETERPGFLHRQLRGLLLLLITIAPLLGAAILGILGKPIRHWVVHEVGKHAFLQGWWNVFFPLMAMLLAMLALTMIYRVARPKEDSLRNVLPGAAVATLLWWIADVAFGAYVRRVPYSVVYGGLAAVIGLIIWMQLSAVIIFLGAAWNAELAETRARGVTADLMGSVDGLPADLPAPKKDYLRSTGYGKKRSRSRSHSRGVAQQSRHFHVECGSLAAAFLPTCFALHWSRFSRAASCLNTLFA